MQVLEVPVPALRSGTALVRNHYSLVSAGTEASTVKAARKGYLGKALERPQQARQVLDFSGTKFCTFAEAAFQQRLAVQPSLEKPSHVVSLKSLKFSETMQLSLSGHNDLKLHSPYELIMTLSPHIFM